MDHQAGRITIIASSTMVHQRVRCMICGQPVDHRVVFMTNDARVLHAGCVPDHVKVPTKVLLQAIRRLERMVARARKEDGAGPGSENAGPEAEQSSEDRGPETDRSEDRDPRDQDPWPRPVAPGRPGASPP
jgi:hypothetical protein